MPPARRTIRQLRPTSLQCAWYLALCLVAAVHHGHGYFARNGVTLQLLGPLQKVSATLVAISLGLPGARPEIAATPEWL